MPTFFLTFLYLFFFKYWNRLNEPIYYLIYFIQDFSRFQDFIKYNAQTQCSTQGQNIKQILHK